jgi:hypothetical protein
MNFVDQSAPDGQPPTCRQLTLTATVSCRAICLRGLHLSCRRLPEMRKTLRLATSLALLLIVLGGLTGCAEEADTTPKVSDESPLLVYRELGPPSPSVPLLQVTVQDDGRVEQEREFSDGRTQRTPFQLSSEQISDLSQVVMDAGLGTLQRQIGSSQSSARIEIRHGDERLWLGSRFLNLPAAAKSARFPALVRLLLSVPGTPPTMP